MTDDIAIDLTQSQTDAESVRNMLLSLRVEHDLRPYEYTSKVRVAPGKYAHSHPVLTLSTMTRQSDELLSVYIHEQMHWYVTWYSYTHHASWKTLRATLLQRYPTIPVKFPEGAHTASSSYLHLIVNWLEIDTVAQLLGRDRAVQLSQNNFVYSGIYKIVLNNWDALGALYLKHDLVPVRLATEMNTEDFAVASRMDEATTDL
jgi:hypothetical protein